jgi:hypothetical protein
MQPLAKQSCDRDYNTRKEAADAAEHQNIVEFGHGVSKKSPGKDKPGLKVDEERNLAPTRRVLDGYEHTTALFQPYCVRRRFGFVALPISAGAAETGPHIASYWN